MTAVVRAEDVRRRYGDTVALDGVTLSLTAGEVFALVGPNGAGKTTLVRALTGTTDAEGTVELFGEPPRAVARERLGVLPQEFRPYERLTARELVSYYAGLYDDPRPVDEVLADVGLDERPASTWYERLSGGQRRRTCVATALVNDPALLVLDEPTTGIDPAGRRALHGLVEDLAADGVTVLITTHDMDEAARLGDRVGLLADGRLVAVDTPASLVAEYGGEPTLTIGGVVDAAGGAAIADELADRLDYPATLADGTISIEGVSPRDIGTVVATLEAVGVDPDELRWSEPDLEDVFMALAGDVAEGSSEGDVDDAYRLSDGGDGR